jgi:hypothetical protein
VVLVVEVPTLQMVELEPLAKETTEVLAPGAMPKVTGRAAAVVVQAGLEQTELLLVLFLGQRESTLAMPLVAQVVRV